MFLLSFCYFCLIIILRLIICGSIPARMDFPIVQYYLFVRMGMVLCGLVLVGGQLFDGLNFQLYNPIDKKKDIVWEYSREYIGS